MVLAKANLSRGKYCPSPAVGPSSSSSSWFTSTSQFPGLTCLVLYTIIRETINAQQAVILGQKAL